MLYDYRVWVTCWYLIFTGFAFWLVLWFLLYGIGIIIRAFQKNLK